MKVDTSHIHYWMHAVRSSKDPIRTLDAFWKGQVSSKEWLIDNLKPYIDKEVDIDIHGGWVGVLASLLFQSGIPIKKIQSIDIDPECESIAMIMNGLEVEQNRFQAITADMCSVNSSADVVINTSCEHISQEQYDLWLSKIPKDRLIVLQSNNFIHEEHIRIADSLDEFKKQSKLKTIWSGELILPKYCRYMIIGYQVE